MADVKINGVPYWGVNTVKLPLAAGNGHAVFAYSHDEISEIPQEGYNLLNYIESCGSQYIDTHISGGSSAEYEIVFDPFAGWVNEYEQYFAGAPCAAPKLFHKFYGPDGPTNDVQCEGKGGTGNAVMFGQDSGKHTVKFDGVDMWVDGAKAGYRVTTSGGWGDLPWYVFSSSSEPNL